MGQPVRDARTPEVSIVIPIYNEERILEQSVATLVEELRSHDLSFEIVLAENGSSDGTIALADTLASRYPGEVHAFSHPEPNYGGALREGIHRARGQYVICEEIDLCHVSFHLEALDLLRAGRAQLVVGSKAMPGSHDRRPVMRRVATRAYNGLLRVTLGFHGTDTHGLKAFRREAVLPIVGQCLVEHDVFASEMVIRCERAGLRVVEVPVEIEEKRPPSINLVRRTPRVFANVGRLIVAIHLSGTRGRADGDGDASPR